MVKERKAINVFFTLEDIEATFPNRSNLPILGIFKRIEMILSKNRKELIKKIIKKKSKDPNFKYDIQNLRIFCFKTLRIIRYRILKLVTVLSKFINDFLIIINKRQ